MNMEPFSILLCTNGRDSTRPALSYGIWLAELLDKPVTFLGINEDEKTNLELHNLIDQTVAELNSHGIPFEQEASSGQVAPALIGMAQSGRYLTVIGPFGRPAWQRVIQGRSFRQILAKIETPIVYVPQPCLPLKRILLCMGGLGFAFSLERLSLLIAKATGANLTLLHIIEPISLNYPTSIEIQRHPNSILDTDTPQAHNLRLAMLEINKYGIPVDLKVRHGNIVHEILDEVHSSEYDLIGLGSPYSAKGLRHLYTPNVTAEVAETINQPVLAVRMGQDLMGDDWAS